MASAAEQLAANLNFSAFAKAEELKKRIWFTLGALLVYRFGTYVPLPGINPDAFAQAFGQAQHGIVGLFNMFTGGAVSRMAILALGIMPYISASIIIQLLTSVVPSLEALKKEGEQGRKVINQYTRYGTVLLATVQAYGLAVGLESATNVVADPGWFFRISTVITMVGGTMFLMWLGEQITSRGIGNGISLIIFAGIVANLPDALFQTASLVRNEQIKPIDLLLIVFIAGLVTAVIVFFERAQRRIPINYAKRIAGRKTYGGQRSHLPLRVNMSGVIPPIFTSSLLMFPMTLANLGVPGMNWLNNHLQPTGPNAWIYLVVFAGMTIFFCFFYTAVTFQPVDVAENLKKQNAVIPSVTPGKATADYIDRVLTRITVGGAAYVAAVCTVPTLLQSNFQVPFYFGGTSLMIVVGVALDTAQQVESHLITRHYEGLTGAKGPRIRGRRG